MICLLDKFVIMLVFECGIWQKCWSFITEDHIEFGVEYSSSKEISTTYLQMLSGFTLSLKFFGKMLTVEPK